METAVSRLVISFAAIAVAVAALPSWAAAQNRLTVVQRGPAFPAMVSGEPADPFGLPGPERVEVLRNGTPVGTPTQPYDWGAGVSLPELLPGDNARYFQGDTLIVSYVYDGLPAVSGVCAGATSFRVATGDLIVTRIAAGLSGGGNANPVTASPQDPGLMQLSRPMAAGDYVEVGGDRIFGGVRVSVQTSLSVRECAPPPAPPTTGAETVPEVAAALTLRAHRIRQGLRVNLKLPQPGTLRLRVSAGGRTLASLRRSGAGAERVTVKLTRRQRARALRVSATLTPTAAGERQTARLVLPRGR